jgi:transposase-like protein
VQEKELQVAKKRKTRLGRYPKEFRRMAVERLKTCDNIVALARELGVHRRLLYKCESNWIRPR